MAGQAGGSTGAWVGPWADGDVSYSQIVMTSRCAEIVALFNVKIKKPGPLFFDSETPECCQAGLISGWVFGVKEGSGFNPKNKHVIISKKKENNRPSNNERGNNEMNMRDQKWEN